MDKTTPDMTKDIALIHIVQVISITNILLYYFGNKNKNTTPSFIVGRYTEVLYKPRVKMRTEYTEVYQLPVQDLDDFQRKKETVFASLGNKK